MAPPNRGRSGRPAAGQRGRGRGRGGTNNAAAHIQARQERRKAAGPRSVQDVFEYATERLEAGNGSKGRAQRRAQANDLEGTGGGGRNGEEDEGDDDENEGGAGARDPRRVDYGTAPILGGAGDDSDDEMNENAIATDDDEDIDSDEALGESDGEPFDDVKFDRQKRASDRRKGRLGRRSDEEESDDEGDSDGSIDGADMVDLSRMLDRDSEDEEEEDDDDEDEVESDERHARLQRRLEQIGGAGRKRAAAEDGEEGGENDASPAKNRRRVLKDRVEALPEGEWNAPSARGQGLTIEDLMKPISDEAGTSLTSIRQAARILRSNEDDRDGKEAVASKRGGTKLSAPLATVIQERLDRSAAYQESKEEVEGWQATIKQLREAPHLSFPLQPDPVQRPTTAALAAYHKPTNGFERSIAALLKLEGATEKQMQKAEELEMNERGMSADEIRQRTAELRKMRDLLFREEQKAKRVSKIKSKTYRRIARKERQRELEKAREAGLLVDGDGEGDEEERRLRAERERAKERATLRHKNAGKWAKSALNAKGLQDMPEARQAIEEQLLRGEQLRRRIHGHEDEDDSDAEDADEFSSEGSDEESDLRRKGFDEMATTQRKGGEQSARDAADAEQGKKAGVWNMKFMREARDCQAKDSEEQMTAFMKEMGDEDGSSSEEEGGDLGARTLHVGDNAGRMVFNVTDKNETGDKTDERATTVNQPLADRSIGIEVKDVRPVRKAEKEEAAGEDVNPWLVSAGTSKVSRKNNEANVSKDGKAQSKAANRVARHAAKSADAQLAREEDGELIIDPTSTINLRGGKDSRQDHNANLSDDESNGSDEERDVEDVSRRHPSAIRQRKLVAEAFAGDDVLANFAAEKAAAMEADAPQEVDTTLAGWGAWGGKGVRKDRRGEEERKKRFTRWTKGLDPSKRKDAGMDKVIINQKHDKKADRYKADDVPFPFTSRAQYEMAMRNPLGPEWNTRTQHQRLTLPRVLTKPGKAIKPIEKMF